MKNEEFATALMLSALLLTGCSSDNEETTGIPSNEDVLELAVYSQNIEEETAAQTREMTAAQTREMTAAQTRAVPPGYAVYPAEGVAAEDVSRIGVFVTTPSMASGEASPGNFIYANNKWNSLVSVREGVDYYIYGYMPSEYFTCQVQTAPKTQNYSSGVTMKFGRMLPVSTHDLCIITGVQDISSADDEVSLTAGNFHYTGKSKEAKNLARLMFDHLFAAARIELKIDAEYAKLRDIRLKEMTMRSTTEVAYTGTVILYSNGSRSTSWQEAGYLAQDEAKSQTLFSDADGVSLSATEAMILNGYCLPTISSTIVVKSKYDVYDTKGNLIRKDCEAENKLSLPSSAGLRGIFKMTVKPTYIYVLSDPDEEPPTITVED